MFTILGADGLEYGPVTVDKVREWFAAGRANLQTQARRTGESEWKPLEAFPEFARLGAPPPLLPAAAPVAPAPEAVTPPVAAPAVTTAAAADPAPAGARAIAADLIARTPKIDVFDCLTKSFELWTKNFWPLVGVTVVVVFIQFLIGLVPLLGLIARFVLNGVFIGGLYYYYLGKMRGQPRELGDAFAGFNLAFLPLAFASMLISGLIVLVLLGFCAPGVIYLLQAALRHHPVFPTFTPLMVLGGLAGALVVTFLSTSWIFTIPLIMDRKLGPWTAMEVSRRVVARQWFRVFFVMLLGSFLTLLGLIGLFIGVLFTLPLSIGATLYAYEGLCHPPDNRAGSSGAASAPG